MPFIPSFPEDHHLSHVFQNFQTGVLPLLQYHDDILRGPGPLTIAERELIAAITSGTNACSFCYGAHSIAAERFGIEEQVMEDLLTDIDAAAVDEKIKPILKYVKKLTEEPSKIIKSDADAVLAAGWSEEALYFAVSVCALFNFMNRIVEGMGVKANPDMLAERRTKLREMNAEERIAEGAKTSGDGDYMAFGRVIGVVKD
jgi:uncharacterized peroxidase-related enzyme